jgi:hypothetical protein
MLAYKNKLASPNTILISFHLASDDALGLWALNNSLCKPEVFVTTNGGDHAYKYFPKNPRGKSCSLPFCSVPLVT